MKRIIVSLVAAVGLLLGLQPALGSATTTDSAPYPAARLAALKAVKAAAVRKAATTASTDYGSGAWGGPVSAPVRTGDPATSDVLLVGDSIGQRCTADIRSALAAKGLTLATVTQSGQNTAGLFQLLQATPHPSAKVLMEAGTNDVFEPFAMPGQVAAVMNWAASNGLEVYWADTYVGRSATVVDDVRNSGQVNEAIASAVSTSHRVKWVEALTAARGRGRALSYYLADGVHPSVTPGCPFYAATVAAVF
jgi:hypothetical protein